MKEYDILRLARGGGIAAGTLRPAEDGLHLFVGLGGLGVDCLRTLKTRLREWLAPLEGEPFFALLGIDTDWMSRQEGQYLLPLDQEEYLLLSLPPTWEPEGEACRRRSLQMQRDALCSRLLDRLGRLRNRREDLPLFVHLVTGLGGRTGSGCFLDLCYLLRQLTGALGPVRLCGYFFLPDTMDSKIPLGNMAHRQAIAANSRAALEALDRCMGRQGCWEGLWTAGRASDQPPVDLACLVGAPEGDPHRGYQKAVENTVQHLAGQLLRPGAVQRLDALTQQIGQAAQDAGRPFYGFLGAEAALAPLGMLQTGLMAMLFAKWAALLEPVSQAEVLNTLQRVGQCLYQTLLYALTQGAGGSCASYCGHWQSMTDYYRDQTAARLDRVGCNQHQLLESGGDSLLAQLCRQLEEVVMDPAHLFCLRNADALSHGLEEMVNGLIRKNDEERRCECAQHDRLCTECEETWLTFQAGGLLFRCRALTAYENAVRALEEHHWRMGVYDAMERLLQQVGRELRTALERYQALGRTFRQLMEVFLENRLLFCCSEPACLLPSQWGVVDRYRPWLTQAVEQADPGALLQDFLGGLQTAEEGEATVRWVRRFVQHHFPEQCAPAFGAELFPLCGAPADGQLTLVLLAAV